MDITKKELDEFIAAAYTIGHTHGFNPMRTNMGDPPSLVDIGWEHVSDLLWKRLTDRSRTSDEEWQRLQETIRTRE